MYSIYFTVTKRHHLPIQSDIDGITTPKVGYQCHRGQKSEGGRNKARILCGNADNSESKRVYPLIQPMMSFRPTVYSEADQDGVPSVTSHANVKLLLACKYDSIPEGQSSGMKSKLEGSKA